MKQTPPPDPCVEKILIAIHIFNNIKKKLTSVKNNLQILHFLPKHNLSQRKKRKKKKTCHDVIDQYFSTNDMKIEFKHKHAQSYLSVHYSLKKV
jgi:hypothetical protein